MPTRVIDRRALTIWPSLIVSGVIASVTAGCWGEPTPLRGSDPARSRAAMLKKFDRPEPKPTRQKSSR